MNKRIFVAVRQPIGEAEYYDWNTRAGQPNYARENARWNESHELDGSYWLDNPVTRIAELNITEVATWSN